MQAQRRARLHSFIGAQVSAGAPRHLIATLEAWNVKQPGGTRAWAVVRVVTREGVEGYGECRTLTREDVASLRAAAVGTDATAYEALRVKTSRLAGCGALNVAVLDILGKQAKAPLFQVLGGPTRFKVRAFTSLHGADDGALLRALEHGKAAGHRAFSVSVPEPPFRNSGKALVLAAQKRMQALQQAAGDGCDFVLSGAGRLTPGDAAQLAAAFERFHLLWFDEPCNTSSLGALRKISGENVTPVGFGEQGSEASYFQNLLREDAVDVVRPEFGTHGVSGIRKIAALAETYYVAVAPRHSLGPLTTAAAIQLAASLPNFFIQHVPLPDTEQDREMRAALAGESVERVKDGYLDMPTGGGLGITVSKAVLNRYGSVVA